MDKSYDYYNYRSESNSDHTRSKYNNGSREHLTDYTISSHIIHMNNSLVALDTKIDRISSNVNYLDKDLRKVEDEVQYVLRKQKDRRFRSNDLEALWNEINMLKNEFKSFETYNQIIKNELKSIQEELKSTQEELKYTTTQLNDFVITHI